MADAEHEITVVAVDPRNAQREAADSHWAYRDAIPGTAAAPAE
jgi:hypothetical protein